MPVEISKHTIIFQEGHRTTVRRGALAYTLKSETAVNDPQWSGEDTMVHMVITLFWEYKIASQEEKKTTLKQCKGFCVGEWQASKASCDLLWVHPGSPHWDRLCTPRELYQISLTRQCCLASPEDQSSWTRSQALQIASHKICSHPVLLPVCHAADSCTSRFISTEGTRAHRAPLPPALI